MQCLGNESPQSAGHAAEDMRLNDMLGDTPGVPVGQGENPGLVLLSPRPFPLTQLFEPWLLPGALPSVQLPCAGPLCAPNTQNS